MTKKEGRAKLCGVDAAPCKSCPYRQDVPSGVWAEEEYEKLKNYDGEIIDQLTKGAAGLFMCHQQTGNLCAGWIATHGVDNLLALRLHGHEVDAKVWSYRTKVPVFKSGQEAAEHGMAEIDEPGVKAQRVIERLVDKLDLDVD
jgi:hypothetical protein